MARADVALQHARKLNSVHLRHHDVAYNYVWNLFLSHLYALFAVCCLYYAEVVAERVGNVLADVGVVFDNQKSRH